MNSKKSKLFTQINKSGRILMASLLVTGSLWASLPTVHAGDAESPTFKRVLPLGNDDLKKGRFYTSVDVDIDNSGNILISSDAVQKFDPQGNALSYLGGSGLNTDGLFNGIRSSAVDADGNVYVAELNGHRIQKFNADGQFLLKFGSYGKTDGQFYFIEGIAVDSSGNVYAVDNDQRVQVFSPNGTFLRKWGSSGSGNGQFFQIKKIAIDSQDNVYVLDASSKKVKKFDKNGIFLSSFGGVTGDGDGEFNDPSSLTVDLEGNIYVADQKRPMYDVMKPPTHNRIQKFNSAGTFITKWGGDGSGDSQFNSISDLDTDANGDVYVSDQGAMGVYAPRVQKFSSTGTYKESIYSISTYPGQFSSPRTVATDSADNVYVADQYNDRVQVFDSKGNVKLQWGGTGTEDGKFSRISTIAVGNNGHVYVADINTSRIQEFDQLGTFIRKWGTSGSADGQFYSPTGLAVDNDGNIYVASNRIQKFSPTGDFLSKVVSNGSADNQVNLPGGMDFDKDGNLYVVDTLNQAVKKFDKDGNFIHKWGGTYGANDGQFNTPRGLALDDQGNLYVTDTSNNRVQQFRSDGDYAFLNKWGIQGSMNNQFSIPYGIAVDTLGNVYVADEGNNRIQKLQLSAASSNADLSLISLSTGTLSPSFAPEVLNYNATVTQATYQIEVTASVSDPSASFSVNNLPAVSGQPSIVLLNEGINAIPIIVTAQDGTSKPYLLTITREPKTDTGTSPNIPAEAAHVTNLAIQGVDISPAFQTDIPSYQASVPNGTQQISVVGDVYHSANQTATLLLNDNIVLQPGVASQPIDLNVGSNLVFVKLIDENSIPLSLYTIQVTRAASTVIPETPVTPTNPPVTSTPTPSPSPASPVVQTSPIVAPPVVIPSVPVVTEPNKPIVFKSEFVNSANLISSIQARLATAQNSAPVQLSDTNAHWAAKTIRTFVELDFAKGYADGTFRPNASITRAEFATLLNRVFQISPGNSNINLKDTANHWAKQDIQTLASAGIISGYGDGNFKPNNAISRQEMVLLISRIMNLDGIQSVGPAKEFSDVGNAYAASAIKAVTDKGILSGNPDGTFAPQAKTTRAEAITAILNMLELDPEISTFLQTIQ